MIEKTKIIYKGDMIMSHYYFGFATAMLFSCIFLYFFTMRIGWLFLSYGLGLLGLFCMGKGLMLYKIAKERYLYYSGKNTLTPQEIKEEMNYNMYRLDKKSVNRRRYLYTIMACLLFLFIGWIIDQKGFAIGTLVPIILYAGTEFCVGLLTEFRLWEYHRQMEKERQG
jgi:hypothetical protein